MRPKVLALVYAAIAVQRFLLPVQAKVPTITDAAAMVTQMVVILGVSVLASDVTTFLVGKARGLVFDRPLSRPRTRNSSPPAGGPSTETPPPAAAGAQPAGSSASLASPPAGGSQAGQGSGQTAPTAPGSSAVAASSGKGGGTFTSTLAAVAGAKSPEVSK